MPGLSLNISLLLQYNLENNLSLMIDELLKFIVYFIHKYSHQINYTIIGKKRKSVVSVYPLAFLFAHTFCNIL